MDAVAQAEIAESLLNAQSTGVPVDPPSRSHPGLTLADAYQIQLRQVHHRLGHGARVKGHRVGLTAVAEQRRLGADQPDYGHLFDDMFLLEGQPVPPGRFIAPRVHPEVAFVLRRPLRGPGVTVADAACAVEVVLPALVILDSRIADWRIGALDSVADNASGGGVVLGAHPTPPGEVDLRLGGCNLHVNGEVVHTGAGGLVLGSPLNALVWLVNAVGVPLSAGHLVLPGALTAAVPVGPGDVVTAVFARMGSVTVRFAAGTTAGGQA